MILEVLVLLVLLEILVTLEILEILEILGSLATLAILALLATLELLETLPISSFEGWSLEKGVRGSGLGMKNAIECKRLRTTNAKMLGVMMTTHPIIH